MGPAVGADTAGARVKHYFDRNDSQNILSNAADISA